MAEHTPTPWICDSEGILPVSRDGVSIVARIPNHPDNKANWDADAAFIVKAVNNHEALIEALEKIEYASRKDSLTDAERLQSIRTVACAMISRVGTVGTKP